MAYLSRSPLYHEKYPYSYMYQMKKKHWVYAMDI